MQPFGLAGRSPFRRRDLRTCPELVPTSWQALLLERAFGPLVRPDRRLLRDCRHPDDNAGSSQKRRGPYGAWRKRVEHRCRRGGRRRGGRWVLRAVLTPPSPTTRFFDQGSRRCPVADGHLSRFAVPFWVVIASALLLTLGTLFGGWRVVRTLGRRIYPIRPLDGLISQGSSGLIVLAASLAGAPISTTDVVAPAVVGVGSGERWRHVRWAVVGKIGLAWLVTLPVSAALAAAFLSVWRLVG